MRRTGKVQYGTFRSKLTSAVKHKSSNLSSEITELVNAEERPAINDDDSVNGNYFRLEPETNLCRDRQYFLQPRDFRVSSCSMCLVYLFPSTHGFQLAMTNKTAFLLRIHHAQYSTQSQSDGHGYTTTTRSATTKTDGGFGSEKDSSESKKRVASVLIGSDNDIHHEVTSRSSNPESVYISEIFPDVEDNTSTEEVCEALSKPQCHRWIRCCNAARDCCHDQMSRRHTEGTFSGHQNRTTHCPQTWDGYSCVNATLAGQVASVGCPDFIADNHLNVGARATRTCLDSGQWWKHPQHRLEWTDYSSCISYNVDSLEAEQIVSIVCNVISLVLLSPAILVFLCIRGRW
ncbi:uncharacterized protein LOC106013513 [Aplysia californica]|uniref:Uncharacterized protein LOC106013513 n=1 Tax=Aplysia californica TaxID=6500 RepID=A0ABM1W2N5_APLCA|nr:uncharacterized protein LOC106013513 [Aplysia californica]